MEITPFKIEVVIPPQDDLLEKIKASSLTLEEHDVVAISSKVVSIWKGRCVPRDRNTKDDLIKKEADFYIEREETPDGAVIQTITNGVLIPAAGIDPFGNFYILPLEKPKEVAEELRKWFVNEYSVENVYVVLTDSRSTLLRRGVIGFAVGWAGFEPLFDNRNRKDLMGNESGGSQVNVPDSLAAAAVLAMGEANEQTPVVRIRKAPYVQTSQTKKQDRFNTFELSIDEDIYAPFLKNIKWKKGK